MKMNKHNTMYPTGRKPMLPLLLSPKIESGLYEGGGEGRGEEAFSSLCQSPLSLTLSPQAKPSFFRDRYMGRGNRMLFATGHFRKPALSVKRIRSWEEFIVELITDGSMTAACFFERT